MAFQHEDWEVIHGGTDKVDVSGPGIAQFVLVELLIAANS